MVDLLTDGYNVKYGARSIHHEVGVCVCVCTLWLKGLNIVLHCCPEKGVA